MPIISTVFMFGFVYFFGLGVKSWSEGRLSKYERKMLDHLVEKNRQLQDELDTIKKQQGKSESRSIIVPFRDRRN